MSKNIVCGYAPAIINNLYTYSFQFKVKTGDLRQWSWVEDTRTIGEPVSLEIRTEQDPSWRMSMNTLATTCPCQLSEIRRYTLVQLLAPAICVSILPSTRSAHTTRPFQHPSAQPYCRLYMVYLPDYQMPSRLRCRRRARDSSNIRSWIELKCLLYWWLYRLTYVVLMQLDHLMGDQMIVCVVNGC